MVIVRLIADNQLTLPDAVLSDLPGIRYFDMTTEPGRIVLAPVRSTRANAVRARLADLELSDADVAEAVDWARRS